MDLKARRSIFHLMNCLGVIGWLGWRVLFPGDYHANSVDLLLKFIILPVVTAEMIWILFHKNYLVVENGTLTIYNDLFRVKRIAVSEIEWVDIRTGPFSRSYFILKNEDRIYFHDVAIASGESTRFFDKLGVPLKVS